MSTFSLNATQERAMTAYTKIILNEAIAALSEKYGFDVEEGSRTIGLADLTVTKSVGKKAKKENKDKKVKKEKKVKAPKPKFALPWTGEVNNELCMGIKNNNFLFTQCTSKPVVGKRYCVGCQKQCAANSFGKPSGGTVEDRLAVGPLDYVGPKDKVKVHSYGNYLAKKGISRDDAVVEAAKFNVEIPEFQFEVHQRKRGRPKKESRSAAVSDSSSESESESDATKKKVKKVKKVKKEVKKVELPNDEESELYKALAEKKKEEKNQEEKNQELEIEEIEMSEVESEMSEVESESESEMSDSE